MRQPSWEPSAGALRAWLLANTQAKPVSLWTVTLVAGTVYRWTDGDVAITVNGTTWSLGPGLSRSRVQQRIGVAVDTMTITVAADSTVLVGSRPILEALAKRVFDGATVLLERAYLDDTNTCKGVMPVFYGRAGGVKSGRSGATMEVRSFAELLDVMIPSELYQPGCRNTLFDAQCGLAMAANTVAGVTNAAGDGTRRTITSTSAAVIAKATGWADLGVLSFTAGANAGISRTVRLHTLAAGTATVTAVYPFPYAIASGDAFTLRAGCDKTSGTCSAKFANVAKFRGEPYIPAPESIT